MLRSGRDFHYVTSHVVPTWPRDCEVMAISILNFFSFLSLTSLFFFRISVYTCWFFFHKYISVLSDWIKVINVLQIYFKIYYTNLFKINFSPLSLSCHAKVFASFALIPPLSLLIYLTRYLITYSNTLLLFKSTRYLKLYLYNQY